MSDEDKIISLVKEYSNDIEVENPRTAIILAAGHGKRIKSSTPKVIHKIWGIPAIVRLAKTIAPALKTENQIVIVGSQAGKIIKTLGKAKNRTFVYQKEQLGTGHAIQQAIKKIPADYQGTLFTFPGDLGLLNKETLRSFTHSFAKNNDKMLLLTGLYSGDPLENFYGRILRSKAKGEENKILDIVQHKDILSLKPREFLKIKNNHFSKKELLELSEFDSGIFAFDFATLRENIFSIKPNNVQKEYYVTDLVAIYSAKNIPFNSFKAKNMETLIGFNDKSILKKVEMTFRKNYYNKLKNIIGIEDENHFFISEKVIQRLMKNDKKHGALDINIRAGVFMDENVFLDKKISLGTNVKLHGNITIKANVVIGDNVIITTFPDQKVTIDSGSVILGHNVIKGNVKINKNVTLNEGVNITGSSEYPTVIGERVTINGSCYVYGCWIEKGTEIESSILIKKKIKCLKLPNNKTQSIKFIIPPPVGMEAISDIK